MSVAEKRARCFATIVYPESAKPGWMDVLAEYHIPSLVSPLHDMDVTEDGELKKPHYHVMIYFAGKKSQSGAQEIFDSICGVGCTVVESRQGYARYLCHFDNPDKAQYSASDVRAFGGADFGEWSELSKDPMVFIPDMMEFIERHDVTSFYQFSLYCARHQPEWHKILATRCTIFFKELLRSRTWEGSSKDSASDIVDAWAEKEK